MHLDFGFLASIIFYALTFFYVRPLYSQIVAPNGFFEYTKTTGDLNKDKIEDAVVVFINCKSNECDEKPESNKIITQVYVSKNKNLKLISSSEGAVCYRCGGIKGDTFVGQPEIQKNSILNFTYEGGSRWMWNHILKWRLDRQDKLQLIGSSMSSFDTIIEPGTWAEDSIGNKVSSDINYNTKRANIEIIDKNLKPKKIRCQLKADFKTPEFELFKFEDFQDGTETCSKN
jgi:hypothetical protein